MRAAEVVWYFVGVGVGWGVRIIYTDLFSKPPPRNGRSGEPAA